MRARIDVSVAFILGTSDLIAEIVLIMTSHSSNDEMAIVNVLTTTQWRSLEIEKMQSAAPGRVDFPVISVLVLSFSRAAVTRENDKLRTRVPSQMDP